MGGGAARPSDGKRSGRRDRPGIPRLRAPPSAWLPVHRFVNRVKDADGFAEDGHTCNAAISMAAIRAGHLSFDLRFNETGGEDTMFFKALRGRGERIAWAEGAHVHEFVPTHRMRASWLFRRWYRTGIVEAQLAQGAAPRLADALAISRAALRGWVRAASAACMRCSPMAGASRTGSSPASIRFAEAPAM